MEIKTGTTRVVLIVNTTIVVKVPSFESWQLFLHGLLGNLQERQWSATRWPQLCPVIHACPLGFFSLMRYARPLTDEEWATFDAKAFVTTPDYSIPAEYRKRSSFGVLDGKIVAVDYGT